MTENRYHEIKSMSRVKHGEGTQRRTLSTVEDAVITRRG